MVRGSGLVREPPRQPLADCSGHGLRISSPRATHPAGRHSERPPWGSAARSGKPNPPRRHNDSGFRASLPPGPQHRPTHQRRRRFRRCRRRAHASRSLAPAETRRQAQPSRSTGRGPNPGTHRNGRRSASGRGPRRLPRTERGYSSQRAAVPHRPDCHARAEEAHTDHPLQPTHLGEHLEVPTRRTLLRADREPHRPSSFLSSPHSISAWPPRSTSVWHCSLQTAAGEPPVSARSSPDSPMRRHSPAPSSQHHAGAPPAQEPPDCAGQPAAAPRSRFSPGSHNSHSPQHPQHSSASPSAPQAHSCSGSYKPAPTTTTEVASPPSPPSPRSASPPSPSPSSAYWPALSARPQQSSAAP